jgi:Ca-activated chloride channel homolog
MTQRFLPVVVFVLGQTALAQDVAIVPRVSPVRTEAPPAALPPTVVRVESSLVLIPTHVTNPNGSPVINLGADAFHLYEDNVEQTIASFNAEDAPISVGLLFDASGSMRNKMDKASQAASRFFAAANPGDEFFLVEIAGRARLVSPFTSDSDELMDRILHFRSAGQTPLFDAIHLAMKEMKSAHNSRKALVILSDGGDNWSTHTFRQIHEALIESDSQVYAIGIFDQDFAHNHSPEEARGPMLLDELTSQTGGRLFPVSRLDDMPEIGARISRELRQQYVLGYYSSNGARDGKFRRVKVTVSSNEPELRVSARKGYYAPGR